MDRTTPTALDEFEAKRLLAAYGIPVVREERVTGVDAAVDAADRIGYPVAIKGCGAAFTHKTELGLVELDLRDAAAVRRAAARLHDAMRGAGELLVQRMVKGRREFLAGMSRDAQFGPVVSFGLGGIFAEALADVAMRVCPLSARDALDMQREIRGRALLGALRGLPEVNTGAIARCLEGLSRLAIERPDIEAIDINPLVVEGSEPVAVDALVLLRAVILGEAKNLDATTEPAPRSPAP
jgi:succinyl-CoA synthetase beta subunit